MKGFTDNAFFLLFEQIISEHNPGHKLDRWSGNGVSWERTRHSFASPVYGFAQDSFVASRPGRNGWSLLVVKEHWWAGRAGAELKSRQWAEPLSGERRHILQWFSECKRALDQ